MEKLKIIALAIFVAGFFLVGIVVILGFMYGSGR